MSDYDTPPRFVWLTEGGDLSHHKPNDPTAVKYARADVMQDEVNRLMGDLAAERAERKQLDEWVSQDKASNERIAREMDSLRAERDDWREVARNENERRKTAQADLSAARAQADGLAKALRRVKLDANAGHLHESTYRHLSDALDEYNLERAALPKEDDHLPGCRVLTGMVNDDYCYKCKRRRADEARRIDWLRQPEAEAPDA